MTTIQPLWRFWSVILACLFCVTAPALADDESNPRILVHLLDYLAKDYGGAVQNGVVKSQSEYAEQREFCHIVVEKAKTFPSIAADERIITAIATLESLIDSKADAVLVAKKAREIQTTVIEASGLSQSPDHWPNLKEAKASFVQNCAVCHGESGHGDGPAGKNLTPPPANFLAQSMEAATPFQLFNTIRLGVPGTGMVSFAQLSDDQTWNLAFYVLSLRFHPSVSPEALGLDPTVLKSMGVNSDRDWLKELPGTPEQKATALATLRLHSDEEPAKGASNHFLAIALTHLKEAQKAYNEGDQEKARSMAIKAYLEGVEPIEPRLKANDPTALQKLEASMAFVRGTIEGQKSADEVSKAIQAAEGQLNAAQALIEDKVVSPLVTFFSGGAILLREGFEAILLVLALLGVIKAVGASHAARWVHAGWMSAVGLGVVSWFLSGYLMRLSGANRELLEGSTAIMAVVVLLYVGFWLHSRTEVGRWREFIDGRVKSLLEGRKLFGLAVISFVAVFREMFETVLFLRAIYVESGDVGRSAMFAGVATAFVLNISLAWALLSSSAKLPIRKLFSISALIMGLLAFVFAGKGLHSLQEAGYVSITTPPIPLSFDVIGIFPTVETLVAQLLTLVLVVGIWKLGSKPSRAPAGLPA